MTPSQTKKLDELATALDMDPVALLAIAVLLRNKDSPSATLDRAKEQVDSFFAAGAEELLREHFSDNELIKRPPGKPQNSKSLEAVRELRAAGCSQSQVVEKLGLSRSTVHRYWRS